MVPTRDDIIRHLDEHALEFRFGTTVTSIDRDGDGWVVRTDAGEQQAA